MQKSIFGQINKILIGLVLITAFSNTAFAQGDIKKDTDFDGLSDEAEINIYNTDINNPDTDDDGVLDYQEIIDKTNPTDPESNIIAQDNPKNKGLEGLPALWMVGRIAGIASFIMFTLVIVMGLTMTSKILIKYRIVPVGDVMQAHQFTAAFIAFVLLVIHFTSFIFDDFIKLEISEIFVPFLLKREVTSAVGQDLTITVGIGIIAFYLSIILLLTSHYKNKFISAKNWRIVHYSSFLFYVLFLAHAYFSGSDSQEPWMITIYVSSIVIVLTLILLRIFGKKYFLPSKKPSIDKPPAKNNLPAETQTISPDIS